MRLVLLLCSLLSFQACNTPSPGFRGVPATRVSIDGSTFAVRVRGQQAEAMRINPQYAPRFGPIKDRAALAMALVSGCEVVQVTGDQALAFGALNCGTGVPVPVRVKPVEVTCIPVRGSEIEEIGQVRVDLDCS